MQKNFLKCPCINTVYHSSVLEFCLFYRAYNIISYLLSFDQTEKDHALASPDFLLSPVYSNAKFSKIFLEQSVLAKENDLKNVIEDNIGIGNAFVKCGEYLYKFPINKHLKCFPELGSEIDKKWDFFRISDKDFTTGQIFIAPVPINTESILQEHCKMCRKPIIYIYPEEENVEGSEKIEIKVNLIQNEFKYTYPTIGTEGKWMVKAKHDGTLLNEADNKEYQSLYWESKAPSRLEEELQKGGSIVHQEDSVLFLEDILPHLGLNNREKNEFIQFWLPIMIKNKTNFIRFLTEEEISSKISKLDILPRPETIIRVYMIFKELTEKEKHFPLQDLEKQFKKRNGYTGVEWGGTDL